MKMIERIALAGLHRALDERRPVPGWVRGLASADASTAAAVDEVLAADAALADPFGVQIELDATREPSDHRHPAEPEEPATSNDARLSRPDPAWWAQASASPGWGRIAALAAVVGLAACVTAVTLRSGPTRPGNTNLATATGPTINIELPTLPDLPNPLAAPTRAVRTALNPATDPAAALQRGAERLGQRLEAPLREEWSAIRTGVGAQWQALARSVRSFAADTNAPAAAPTAPDADAPAAPSTRDPRRPEPAATAAV